MIFTGKRGVRGQASSLLNKEEGMNIFLRDLGITYRRDIDTGRPRVNKPSSKLDREQKESKSYYYLSKFWIMVEKFMIKVSNGYFWKVPFLFHLLDINNSNPMIWIWK